MEATADGRKLRPRSVRSNRRGTTVITRRLDRKHAQWYIYTVMQSLVFEMLADPSRRSIVEALRAGEQAVNDLVDRVEIHQSGVSRHLRILLEAGFVQVRPDGQQRFYSLKPEPFRELDAWVAGYRALWEARLDRFGAALRRRRSGKS